MGHGIPAGCEYDVATPGPGPGPHRGRYEVMILGGGFGGVEGVTCCRRLRARPAAAVARKAKLIVGGERIRPRRRTAPQVPPPTWLPLPSPASSTVDDILWR